MTTATLTIAITRTQTATYVAAKLVGSFQEILAEIGVSGSYVHDWTSVESALQIWMDEGSLRNATIEVWDRDTDRAVAVFDHRLRYATVAPADEDLRHDMATTRNAARRAAHGGLPSRLAFRVVVDHEPWATDIPGWTSTTYRSRDHLSRRTMGEVAGGGHMTAGLEFWVRR